MNLTTLLTVCRRKVEQERRIPFDVTADADPFYSDSDVRCLKAKPDALNAGTLLLEEHDLIDAGGCGGDYIAGRRCLGGLLRLAE